MKTILQRLAQRVACVPLVISLALAGCGNNESAKPERKVLYYQSAMHPWIKSDKPGRCTVCGMELTPIYEGESGLDVGGNVISLSETSIRVLNVQTTEVKTQALTKSLSVAGTIEQDDTQRRVLSGGLGFGMAEVKGPVRSGPPAGPAPLSGGGDGILGSVTAALLTVRWFPPLAGRSAS